MRKNGILAVLLLLCLALLSGSAWATDIFVATNGNDTTGNGTIGSPYATLQKAADLAVAGDTIQVRAGTYTQHCYWYLGAGSPSAPITMQAYDGDRTAVIQKDSPTDQGWTIILDTCQYINIVGLDLSGAYYAIMVTGPAGTSSNSHHLQVKRCYIHDSISGDDVKGNNSTYVTYDGNEIAFPGHTGNNQGIDNLAIDYPVYRNNYLHDLSDAGIVPKGGCHYPLLEGNVIVGAVAGATSFGGQTGYSDQEPGTTYQTYYMVVRNNIFANGQCGATGDSDCFHGYFYNNLVYNTNTYLIVRHTSDTPWCPQTTGFYVFNNIFMDTRGQMPPVYYKQADGYTDWQHDYNCYWNNRKAIPTGTWSGFDPNQEPHSTFGDPGLSMSGGTPTTWQGWVNYFRPLWGTKSNAVLKDKGLAAGGIPCPGVIKDIDGNPRPRGSAWDIGPYEYQGTVVVPVANFSGAIEGVLGQQLWGTPGSTFDFTDYSTGGPTSWSWSFGDGGSSTAQNPSHTYASLGSYTVTLTATNSAGSSAPCALTNYITIKALNAAFTADHTYGGTPLTVNFTDQSSNSPTSWSWVFGDGGTSNAQNPSHTYNTAGYYTVALTAAKATGSDLCTKTNYIAPGREVLLYPNACTLTAGTWVSGALSDLQTTNGVYYVIASTSPPSPAIQAKYYAAFPYRPGDVAGFQVEFYGHENPATTSEILMYVGDSTDAGAALVFEGALPTTNTTESLQINGDPSPYLYNGSLSLRTCLCNSKGDLLGTTLYADMLRWHIYIKPPTAAPVADFTGTPPTGTVPLTVNFIDTSINIPDTWAWTFGDGGTSTLQNPSHTYNALGYYTVSLTASNALGQNTVTKTNYITGCNEVIVYPTSYTLTTGSLASGGLSNLQVEDGSAMDIACSSVQQSGCTPPYGVYSSELLFYSDTIYTPSQICGITLECKARSSVSGAPTCLRFFLNDTESAGCPVQPNFPNTFTWTTVSRYSNMSTYMDANGVVHFRVCNKVGPSAYHILYDVVRWHLYLTPGVAAPVADFSGTPTSGASPLAVAFTDTSTNTPTAWSWTFGDSTTSTVRNPSHTYNNAGSFTVALTATNAGGSNTKTKTNYITVTAGAPTFVAAGTVAAGTAAITPALPAGIATNDILLLFVETANQAITIANQNGGTWTEVTGSPQGVGTAGSTTATRLTVFWSRYNGTQGAPTTSDSGDHQNGGMIAIRGAALTGNPWDVTAGGTEATADLSAAIPGATTTVANTLVVTALATSQPDFNDVTNYTVWANADLTSLTERMDSATNAGNGGGVGVATGVKATAGAYATTTLTCGSSASKGLMSIAIKP